MPTILEATGLDREDLYGPSRKNWGRKLSASKKILELSRVIVDASPNPDYSRIGLDASKIIFGDRFGSLVWKKFSYSYADYKTDIMGALWKGYHEASLVRIAARVGISSAMYVMAGNDKGIAIQRIVEENTPRHMLWEHAPFIPETSCWHVNMLGVEVAWKASGYNLQTFEILWKNIMFFVENRLGESGRSHDTYQGGVHWGELIFKMIPPRRMVRRGKEREWLRGRSYLLRCGIDPRISYVDRIELALGSTKSPEKKAAILLAALWAEGDSEAQWTKTSELFRDPTKILDLYRSLGERHELSQGAFRGFIAASAWKREFGRVPRSSAIRKLPEELVALLKPVWKYFQRMLKGIDVHAEESAHVIEAAARVAVCFGKDYPMWIRGKDLHDAGINLPAWLNKEQKHFMLKHRNKSSWGKLHLVVKGWDWVMSHGGVEGRNLDDVMGILASIKFEGASSPDFAMEAGKWGVPEWKYLYLEKAWVQGLKKQLHEDIPMVDFVKGGYRFHRLAKDDPRGIFLGLYTDCCQHPGGAGSSCAWHGHERHDGAFVVIEDSHGRIVAQSWCWRRDDTLVFDNIESKAWRISMASLYKEAAERFCASGWGIKNVNVGTGYDDADVKDWTDPTGTVATPNGVYTDAGRQRRIHSDGN